jgi:hypothetical protein
MDDLSVLRMFNLVVGAIGIVIGLAVIFAPKAMRNIEKGLDKDITTDNLQKILERRRDISDFLFRYAKAFGTLLVLTSLFLLFTSIITS